jgi:excisionase family DNA binding protein
MARRIADERQTLTVEEAARVLGIARGSAYEAARVGHLPTIRIGRRLLVPRAALERLLGGDPGPPVATPLGPRDGRRDPAPGDRWSAGGGA